jgi:hypothetical protein
MVDKTPVNVKKDYRIKNPTGMAKKMREAVENMTMKASPRLQKEMDAVKRHADEHEGGHTPGFPLGKRRSTSDGFMPMRKLYKNAKNKVAENIKNKGRFSDKEIMDKHYYNTPTARKEEFKVKQRTAQ